MKFIKSPNFQYVSNNSNWAPQANSLSINIAHFIADDDNIAKLKEGGFSIENRERTIRCWIIWRQQTQTQSNTLDIRISINKYVSYRRVRPKPKYMDVPTVSPELSALENINKC